MARTSGSPMLGLRDRNSSAISCAAETWYEDRFFWRPHPTKRSTSISVTIDTQISEDMQDYSLLYLNNGTIFQYNFSILTSQYSMSLSKCADFIFFSEKYDLPWDSEYSRATANIFVLPAGRNISVNTCDMSVEGENMAYWTSESRESLWMGNSSSFLLATHNNFTLIMTFDDQKSKMGVYYLFLNTKWTKPPDFLILRETTEGEKGINVSFISLSGADHISTNSFFFGLGFRCYDMSSCTNGMEWTAVNQDSSFISEYHLYISLGERLSPPSPVGKNYLEWHQADFHIDGPASKPEGHIRVLLFPEGMEKHTVKVTTDVPELRRRMTYSIDVTWTEKLPDYLFFFPSLDFFGMKCKRDILCDNQLFFRIQKPSKWPIVELDIYFQQPQNFENYAIFLTDEYQMDFKIYRFSSDPPSDTTAVPSTDHTIATQSDSIAIISSDSTVATPSGPTVFTSSDSTVATPSGPTVFTSSDSTVATPSGPTVFTSSDSTVAVPSGPTVATPDRSDNTFSKNSVIVLLAVVAGACLLALVTVLPINIMRSRKVRSRSETDQQAATETSERRQSDGYEILPGERISGDYDHIVEETDQQAATESSERRQSDGYEVLPGERISGDYEHIVEERGLSDGYESMVNEDFPRNVLCDRNVSSSSHYQTISLENLETSPRGASALSQKNETLLKMSKSCGDLTSGKADTFEHADNRKTSTEQEPKLFCSTFGRQNNEEEEQPRLQWFMLRDSTDGDSFAGAFYSTEAEQCMELQDFSTRGRCSADADGECEYLTELDSSREHEDYLELIAD
ncbi:histone-lysine N-methyltransferase SETMAR [Plakobranchus ocellatus]|uniref:Histone-lysine N-methyltransferase SETMAR n=1 Tax=Plakobranchus ocellatus TaxID=259542 RepID=A0AAV3Z1I8_9GAST|nr:histone-lysine N-methyltransferase SETMAR [Plakobranchus ocellatus]